MSDKLDRRDLIRKSLAASAGAAVGLSLEEKALLVRRTDRGSTAARKGAAAGMPTGKIGDVEISRIICGGNLINGFAHDRDLIYVSSLLRHYFTDEKIMETWELCEEVGINTMISTVHSPYADGRDPTIRVVRRYYDEFGGKIKWIAQCFPSDDDLYGRVKVAVENGAAGAFIQGQVADMWVLHERMDDIARVVDFIRDKGLIAGVACHSIEVPIACEKAGLDVDFYMKTLHKPDYWSATPEAGQPPFVLPPFDNMWSLTPEKTIEFMETVDKPWIAYKVLAAGAIHPRDGFKYAFDGGADFACVGMLDFQVREDAIIAKDTIAKASRKRPWRA